MPVAHAEEAAEADHRVSDPAADLVDHHVLDIAEVLAARVVDAGALDLIGGNEAARGVVRTSGVVAPEERRSRASGSAHAHDPPQIAQRIERPDLANQVACRRPTQYR